MSYHHKDTIVLFSMSFILLLFGYGCFVEHYNWIGGFFVSASGAVLTSQLVMLWERRKILAKEQHQQDLGPYRSIVLENDSATCYNTNMLRKRTYHVDPQHLPFCHSTPRRNSVMDTIGKVILGIVGGLFILAIILGIDALIAWVLMELWNYVVCYFHHTELQVTFWISFAVLIICNILFKGHTTVSKD